MKKSKQIDKTSDSKWQDLVNALDNYIKILGEEAGETAVIAHIHGWRSTRFQEGEILRRQIKQLRANVTSNSNPGLLAEMTKGNYTPIKSPNIPTCSLCGKERGLHKAKTLNCPQGPTSKDHRMGFPTPDLQTPHGRNVQRED